jgi:large-conductance mechanosensitive channel
MDWDTITDPFKDFVTIVFEYLPRIVGALALLILAWIVAKVLRWAVKKALRTAKIDERIDKEPTATRQKFPIADGAGTVAYWLVWLLFIPAALGVLGLTGVLDPVRDMIDEILDAVPNIVGAAFVLLVAYLIGRFLATLVANLLTRVGFNRVLVRLGVTKEVTEGQWTPSTIVGYLVLTTVMLFGLIAAANLLDFGTVNELVSDFTVFFGKVIWGLVILGVGIFLAALVSKLVQASGRPQAGILATIVQVSIILLAGAIALRAMGFANDVVLMAFGLLLGAAAVAAAVAFGLGGREVARDQLDRWAKSLRGEDKGKS